jgi:hypothetical protein
MSDLRCFMSISLDGLVARPESEHGGPARGWGESSYRAVK